MPITYSQADSGEAKANAWRDMGERRFIANDGAGIGGAIVAELADLA